jgi:hypothetical protein
MKIIECSPFFREEMLARVHIPESCKWVDEFHILEANRTHQDKPKEFVFDRRLLEQFRNVHYHAADVSSLFKHSRKLIPRMLATPLSSGRRMVWNTAWYNEGLQRNLATSFPDIRDDDILILSDFDEIIDSKLAERLVGEVMKRGIVTVRLHQTVFYFDLFCKRMDGHVVPDWSYRVVMLMGSVFRRKWKSDSNWLRKLGERGGLVDQVFCPEGFHGFHITFLGDESLVSQKLAAYAHTEMNHLNTEKHIRACIRNRRSIYGQELETDGSIPLLSSVESLRSEFPARFLGKH